MLGIPQICYLCLSPAFWPRILCVLFTDPWIPLRSVWLLLFARKTIIAWWNVFGIHDQWNETGCYVRCIWNRSQKIKKVISLKGKCYVQIPFWQGIILISIVEKILPHHLRNIVDERELLLSRRTNSACLFQWGGPWRKLLLNHAANCCSCYLCFLIFKGNRFFIYLFKFRNFRLRLFA